MRRHPIRAALGAALATLVLAPAAAPAAAPLPAAALTRVGYPDDDPAFGYGSADLCGVCGRSLGNWAGADRYVLAPTDSGLVVARIADGVVRRSTFTTAPPYRRTSTRVLRFPGWTVGGALQGPDGSFYVLVGRANEHEDDTRSVIEVRRFDAALDETGSAQVYGGFDENGIYQPFEATASSMALAGTTLLVHTARLIYHKPGDSAPHHQVNLTFAVDTTTMAAQPVWNSPYSSHSFRQFVRVQNGDDAVFLDHGDAYPRALQLAVTPDAFGAAPDPRRCSPDDPLLNALCDPAPETRSFDILPFPGATGENRTGTTVNGFEVGATQALTVGLSVPHDHPVQGVSGSAANLLPNAYVIVTDTTTGTSRFTWLTRYRPTNRWASVSQPQLIPTGDGRFVVLFATTLRSKVTMHYRLLDEQGQLLATRSWRRRFAPVAQPARAGTTIFWAGYAPGGSARRRRGGDYLYALDITDPLRPAIVRR